MKPIYPYSPRPGVTRVLAMAVVLASVPGCFAVDDGGTVVTDAPPYVNAAVAYVAYDGRQSTAGWPAQEP